MAARKPKEELELFHAYLRQNGLKKTYQKDLILRTFLGSEGHMSVEDVHQQVRRKDRKVGIVTVFRTLKSLTACGIAREIALGDGLTRFEHGYRHPHHHHIVCTQCHETIEFASPELERLQDRVAEKYHFESVGHRFQIYGVCEECRSNRRPRAARKWDSERIFGRDALRVAISMEKRGIDFYREAAERNQDLAGRQVLMGIAEQQVRHLGRLEWELEQVQHQKQGLESAPVFLHFDPRELEKLMPDLQKYEVDGRLELSAREAMDLAVQFENCASDFFREYAGRFVDTTGRRVFLRFAEQELGHHQVVEKRILGVG